jgi:hypothetical protein
MTDLTFNLTDETRPANLLRRMWAGSRALTVFGFAALGLTLLTALMAAIDPRWITGAPAWIKPFKFAVSMLFYTFTLAWMLSFVEGRVFWKRLIGWVTAGTLTIELILIILQVVRGVRSHFNIATPFDTAVFSSMGSIILIAWMMNLLAAVLLFRQKLPAGGLSAAIRLGLMITLVGAGLAFLMVVPTSAQRAAMASGQALTVAGAHSVGVEDGGPGLPLLGWSTTGGDLRIPHFVGLHALQVLPLFALLLAALSRGRLGNRKEAALTWIFGFGYLSLTLLLAWQALRGQPIIAPDGPTLVALGGLILAVGAAALLVVRGGNQRNTTGSSNPAVHISGD